MEIGKIKVTADEGLMEISYDDGTIVFSGSAKDSNNIEKAICKAYELGVNNSPYNPKNRYK